MAGPFNPFALIRKASEVASKAKTTFEMAQELAQKRAALPVSQRGLGLPANNTAEQRAAAMGFDTTAYHGTHSDVPVFDRRKNKTAKDIYSSPNPVESSAYAENLGGLDGNVMPLLLRGGVKDLTQESSYVTNQLRKAYNAQVRKSERKYYPFEQFQDSFKRGQLYQDSGGQSAQNALVDELIGNKNPILKIPDAVSGGGVGESYVVANPDNIRSRFAAFDPFRKDVATAAAMGVAAPDLLAAEPDKKAVGGLAGSLIRKAGEVASKTKPFYSAVDEAISSLPNKALGDQFIKEMLKRGVKPQEIIDRNLDNILGAPIVQKTRTVNLKKPDKKGRTQIEEKYFEMTPSEKGAKSISRADVEKAASDNPPPQIVERTISDKSIDQEVERRLSDRMESMIEDKMDEMDWQSWGVKNARSMARADAEEEVLRETANLRKEIHAEIMDEGGFDPQYKKWSTPGGTNYREIVIKLPNKDLSTNVISKELFGKEMRFLSEGEKDAVHAEIRRQFAARPEFQSRHYGDMNVLAHARVQDRTGPNGEKILQIEEIQSDWHQKGRKSGYQKITTAEANAQASELEKQGRQIEYKAATENERPLTAAESEEYINLQRMAAQLRGEANVGVPDAPFKNNWHELVMKRLLDDAARNGYDRVVITPGAEQAKRYDLSKQIRSLEYESQGDGTYHVIAIDNKGNSLLGDKYTQSQLENTVGKEIAEKIVNNKGPMMEGMGPGREYRELSGLDLQVGGEGMRDFYDLMLPAFLNKYGEKHGSRVGSMNITVPPKDSMAVQGYPLGEDYMFGRATWDEFLAANPRAAEEFSMPVHSFDINPAMRGEITQKGVPLYQAAPPAAIGAAASEGDENGGGNTTTFFKGGAVHMQSGGLDRPVTMNPNIAAQGKEIKFLREISATPWYLEFLKQYGKAPDLSKNSDYDYRKAWEAGIRPERSPYDENRFHWPSSTNAGEMLKSATHPTAWKEHYMRATGVDPDSVGIKKEDWIKSNSIEQSFSKLNDGMKRGGAVNQDAMNMAVMNKQLRKRHG